MLSNASHGDNNLSNVLSSQAQLVAALLQLSSRIHFKLGPAMQAVFARGVHSSGKRALMRNLVDHGPLTIPQMAMMRPVSRQFIRALVEELVLEEFVQLAPNPAHKTAALVTLTAKGRKQARLDASLEAELLELLAVDLSEDDLKVAAATLSALLTRVEAST